MSLPLTGYAGQRYEVSCLGFHENDPDCRKVVGWTNDPTGGGLVQMVKAHPCWSSPKVRDLFPGPEEGTGTVDDLKAGIALLMRAHYRLMDNPRFWYEKDLMEASKILCVLASDMRLEVRKIEASVKTLSSEK